MKGDVLGTQSKRSFGHLREQAVNLKPQLELCIVKVRTYQVVDQKSKCPSM